MKRIIAWILICLMAALAGCAVTPDEPVVTTQSSTVAPPTTAPSTQPPTEPTTEPTTAPLHSELYIPGLDVEDVILYFNEVSLAAEYSDNGDPSVVQKWDEPIYYRIQGEATDEDLIVFNNMVAWLGTVEGFPGMFPAPEDYMTNLEVYFCTAEELEARMGENYVGSDGAVIYWYIDDRIYTADICYSTDIGQYTRNSVILEEIYNGLGPVQDTDLREDSLIYSGFSEPQWMTDIDELIMKLLYHPSIQPGMNAEECETIIRQLYY